MGVSIFFKSHTFNQPPRTPPMNSNILAKLHDPLTLRPRNQLVPASEMARDDAPLFLQLFWSLASCNGGADFKTAVAKFDNYNLLPGFLHNAKDALQHDHRQLAS